MTIAWFRASSPHASDPLDDTAALIDELRATHTIDVILEAEAHDFVPRDFRTPWDLCVYELDDTHAHRFEWAYLLNYPGVVLLRSTAVQHSWGDDLSREGRLDGYMAGFHLDGREKEPPALRVPLFASRSVVVGYASLAESLQEAHPGARLRYAPIGVRGGRVGRDGRNDGRLIVGAPGRQRLDPIRRAVERARAAGADVELLSDGPAEHVIAQSDVIVTLPWPPYEAPLTPVLAGMAAGKAVVTLELDSTADWPALDPQTWKSRGIVPTAAPIAVTIDPRDETHSLMLALRHLAANVELRERLGRAARDWWTDRATPSHAAAAWNRILEEAASLGPPPRPAGWPRHLGADGTELARQIRAEFGLRTTSDESLL